MKGIIIGEKAVKDKLSYDSRKPRPQIALGRDPKHLDIFTAKGTAISIASAGPNSAQEVLFSMKHNLGYKPEVLVYYYNTSDKTYSIGTYIIPDASFPINDVITKSVNSTTFSIVHNLDSSGFPFDYTSTAPNYELRIKYMIFSNPAGAITNPALDT